MAILLNWILSGHGVDPKYARLLRHQDQRALPGRSPYDLWRNNPEAFVRYHSVQSFDNWPKFKDAKVWVSFVTTPSGEILLAGVYKVNYRGKLKQNIPSEINDQIVKAGSCDQYVLTDIAKFSDLTGRLVIDWGAGALAWVQYADRQNKMVKELRSEFKDAEFPGYLNFSESLSRLGNIYPSWAALLKAGKGIYLLTCPRTGEHYVGKADGEQGFWQRWQAYVADGHGGNVALKSRKRSDYRITVLEVAGSNATPDEIARMEQRWKDKLESRLRGLNRN